MYGNRGLNPGFPEEGRFILNGVPHKGMDVLRFSVIRGRSPDSSVYGICG